jgi:hypothetical protein
MKYLTNNPQINIIDKYSSICFNVQALCESNPSTHLATMALPYPHWAHEHSSFKHHLTLNYAIDRPLWNRPQTRLINMSIREIPMSYFFSQKADSILPLKENKD